jgi:hypothetical protein
LLPVRLSYFELDATIDESLLFGFNIGIAGGLAPLLNVFEYDWLSGVAGRHKRLDEC